VRSKVYLLFALAAALGGCTAMREQDSAEAKEHYLAAKARCVEEYPNSLASQSDCRTQAANTYIRPFYRYGDLMTRAQEQRRELAVEADRHEITRRAYDQRVAQSDAAIARDEDRRNALYGSGSTSEGNPFAGFFDAFAGLFR
jgi:choline dehydrogenase-like flavoprotein